MNLKNSRNYFSVILCLILLSGCKTMTRKEMVSNYNETVNTWTSHKDVGKWLNSNFNFSSSRQSEISSRLKSMKAEGLLVRDHVTLFNTKYGFCADSANFSLKTLNKINKNYNARSVFIFNKMGPPHHWVTAFDYNGKIYIMDYGTGNHWSDLQGTHGPYKSLKEYKKYINSLNVSGFYASTVFEREFPGEED